MIRYNRQCLNAEDLNAVQAALQGDMITQGETVSQFEAELATYTGAEHVVVCSHGTSALHIACLALGIGKGDKVWTSPISFAASANCALYCGAEVDFVDIELDYIAICPSMLEKKLQQAKMEKALPKAIIAVDYGGQPGHLRQIYQLAQDYGVRIIEDACHALGGGYFGAKVGSCQFADICITSFHPIKTITTGEGGALFTNQPQLAKLARKYANHGIQRNPQPEAPWLAEQSVLGFNYRMTEFQAALGLSQLSKIETFVTARQELAANYRQLLAGSSFKSLSVNPDAHSSQHLYPIVLPEKIWDRKAELFNWLLQQGVSCQVHYLPIPLHPYYQQLGFNADATPNALQHYKSTLSIPLFVDLQFSQQQHVVRCLLEFESKVLS